MAVAAMRQSITFLLQEDHRLSGIGFIVADGKIVEMDAVSDPRTRGTDSGGSGATAHMTDVCRTPPSFRIKWGCNSDRWPR
jgi:hypothetical protein